MDRLLVAVLLVLCLAVAACSGGDSPVDAAVERAVDQRRIEGPITQPIHDLPRAPDMEAPDAGVAEAG